MLLRHSIVRVIAPDWLPGFDGSKKIGNPENEEQIAKQVDVLKSCLF